MMCRNALSGDELYTFNHKHIVKAVNFSLDSNQLYTGGQEKKLRIFDLNNYDAEPIILQHNNNITHVIALPDNNLIATASSEPDIKIWDKRTHQLAQTISTNNNTVNSLSLSLDQSTLSVSTGKLVNFLNANNFQELKSLSLAQSIDCVAYDPNTQRFITGSESELWQTSQHNTAQTSIALRI
jgi:serine-threonine kinase receptor-associated protein